MLPRPDKSHAPIPARGSRFIAWLALLFSMMALMISSLTFMAAWHDGELLGSANEWLRNANRALHNRKTARIAAPAAEAPTTSEAPAEPPSALQTQWQRFCDKLDKAEVMIQAKDGGVREYLDDLKTDIAELKAKGTVSGGQWLDQANAKLKAIREQAAVDGPAAARRLRELAGEVRQYAQTLHRVNSALRATPAENPPPEGPRP